MDPMDTDITDEQYLTYVHSWTSRAVWEQQGIDSVMLVLQEVVQHYFASRGARVFIVPTTPGLLPDNSTEEPQPAAPAPPEAPDGASPDPGPRQTADTPEDGPVAGRICPGCGRPYVCHLEGCPGCAPHLPWLRLCTPSSATCHPIFCNLCCRATHRCAQAPGVEPGPAGDDCDVSAGAAPAEAAPDFTGTPPSPSSASSCSSESPATGTWASGERYLGDGRGLESDEEFANRQYCVKRRRN